jgi:hypothetical protein
MGDLLSEDNNDNSNNILVQKLVDNFRDAFNSHDPKILGSLLTEDGEWTDVIGYTMIGRNDMENEHVYPLYVKMPPTLAQYLSDILASVFLISGSDFLPMTKSLYNWFFLLLLLLLFSSSGAVTIKNRLDIFNTFYLFSTFFGL